MLSICPVVVVAAPIDRVWRVLTDTAAYDRWWDARTERLEPAGPAAAGQVLYGSSPALGRRWPVVLRVEQVDTVRRQLYLRTTLPFGLTMANRIACAAVAGGRTRVQFG